MINWILGSAIVGSTVYIISKRIIALRKPKNSCSGNCNNCPYH